MSTIPASELVNVNPSVLGAGGSALDIIALLLTTNSRVPIGTVPGFPDAASVQDYFGPGDEATWAGIYFGGFAGANKRPSNLLFAQYNASAVAAYLRGGDVSGLTLANLQALSGVLTIVVDGVTAAGTVDLAAATSFSNAAEIVETALNLGVAATGSIAANVVTGSIAPNSVTASIAGTTMTVSAVATGVLAPGQTISGSGVANGTTVVAQLTGTAGSTGTYQVSISQTVTSTTVVASGGGLTVTAVVSGTLAVGQTISGSGVTAGTTITALATGSGGTGKYAVSASQTASSTTITATGGTLTISAVSAGTLAVNDVVLGAGVTAGNKITAFLTGAGTTGTYLVSVGDTVSSEALTVAGAGVDGTYDSVSGAFKFASATTGPSSTIGYGSGAIATSLKLTSATGASLSQGAAAAAPAAFMNGVVAVTTDWVNFSTLFDPDVSGSANKQAFAAWKNTQNNRYGYVAWDTDVSPTVSVPAAASLGQILDANGDSGTNLNWAADAAGGNALAAFVCGAAASIDFDQTDGRITFAFKRQDGLVATVSDATIAANLGGNPQTSARGNFYNFYGAYATANAAFTWYQRGFATGDFAWFDSYVNQVWLNAKMQIALLTLQENARSIPYSASGQGLVEAALQDPIADGLNFGAFGPGEISAAQAAEVNAAAGASVSGTLQTQGYYLQIKQASSAVRAARTSPPCTFWYLDRGSVQAINLGSVALQ